MIELHTIRTCIINIVDNVPYGKGLVKEVLRKFNIKSVMQLHKSEYERFHKDLVKILKR